MASIAAIGFCCIDSYRNLGLSYPTGNGIDSIAHLSRRGVRCAAVSVVGTDENGKRMLSRLKEMGIDVSHMQIRPGETSVFEMELLPNNDRVHLKNIQGVMENYAPTEEDIQFVQGFDYIHTDLFGKVLELIPRLKEKGSKLILDFSQFANEENMAKLLPDVDYAFFSVGEGNEQKAVELLKQAKALGGSIMTATLGEDGCICYDGETFYRGHSVRAEKVVNTVGAGDSFIAGFMEGIMKGMDIPACIRNGAELASTVVAQFEPY